jgi:hypothetical protein
MVAGFTSRGFGAEKHGDIFNWTESCSYYGIPVSTSLP